MGFGIPVSAPIAERIARLDLPFNSYGLDPYGVSREHLMGFYTVLSWLYRNYWRVTCKRIHLVPERGRTMLIGNHSGSLPVDAGMVLTSLVADRDPPRLAHSMVEKFAQQWPFVSSNFNRVGQFTGLPEHAERLLNDDRALLVFPEGARGTGKLYKDRYKLVRFGTGFMRLALKTNTPITPFAFIGGEESLPAMFHLTTLAKIVGAPYWPVPPHILPIPLPVACQIYYGEPLHFEGDGTEPDEIILGYVETVRDAIQDLIREGLHERENNPELS